MDREPDRKHDSNIERLFEPVIVGSTFGSVPETNIDSMFKEANLLHSRNRLEETELAYRKILSLIPEHSGALHFLGIIELTRKNLLEALRLIEQSLRYENSNAVYFNNHGVVLNELGRFGKAEKSFENAVKLKPDYADALSNLGMIGMKLNRPLEHPEKYLLGALHVDTNHRDALGHLLSLYSQQKRHWDVVPVLLKLLNTVPDNADLEHRLACAYGNCDEIEKSKRHFRKALSLPGGKPEWRWKHLWYAPVSFENEKQIDEFWTRLNEDLDEAVSENPIYDWKTLPYHGFTRSFKLPHYNKCCRNVLEKYARLFAPSFPFQRPDYRPGKKIRVGFLVTPGHEGGFLRMNTGLMERLDPNRFDVALIYRNDTSEFYRDKIQRDDLINIRYDVNFLNAVEDIRNARCDLIYYWKVGADTLNYFLPMARLAPIQVTSWGTQGTTGLFQIDYYVSWDKAESANAEEHYTERLFKINTSPHFEPKLTFIPPPATRTELNLPEKGAMYFCPHQIPKYQPVFDEYLREVLLNDQNGFLVLLTGRPSPMSEAVVKRIKRSLGDDLFRRVITFPKLPPHKYYQMLSATTLILNSPTFASEITAVDAFHYGIPYVTRRGELLVQRYSSAFYEEFGIDGPVVDNRNEYVEQAVKIGNDSSYRNSISRKILDNHSSFFENQNTVHEWERFIEEAIEARLS